jgi:hypothetical protein
VRLASTTPGWRLLFPAKSYDAAADVMVVRTASISCDVSFDDSPSTRPAVQVTAAPSYREAGEWIVDAKRVGSSAWMRTEAPSVVLASTRTTTTPFAIETPLFSEVTFLAAADRYLADHASVSFSGVDPASVRVHLTLRRARRISVEVTDPDGSPVSRAVFQYAVQRAGPSATLNPEIEFMVRDSLRTAFTGTSSPKTGAAVINQIVQSETDVNGMAAVTQPVNGAVEYLIVWADGFAPYVARRSMGAEQDDVVAVTLERVEARCRRYRLVRGGRPLRGAVLLLAEKLPDGFTPAMPSITADGDGFIPGSRVVADRTYSASVFDHSARKTYHGDLAFGSTEDVDLGSLAE